MKARALLAVLIATLALNGIAYLAHVDNATASGGHTELCGYCATFGALGSSPADLPKPQLPVPVLSLVVLLLVAPQLRRHVTAARPRAPPAS